MGSLFLLYNFAIFIFTIMIRLTKGSTGTIYISLRDKRLTTSDVYTFLFQNEVTSEQVTLNLTDTSVHKERYSEFSVSSVTFNSASVGFWRYYVTQTGSGTTQIATGKMELVTTEPTISKYSGYDGSYKAYTK
jgi:hypothetical protein